MSLHRLYTLSKVVVQSQRISALSIPATISTNSRLLSTAKSNIAKSGLKHEKEKLRSYVIQRYMEYVQNYTKVLEARFPAAMRMYRVFSVGIKDFYRDLKRFITLRIQVKKDKGFSQLSRQDIELYYKMPSDMWRIAPVLILSAIPFGNYIIFPLAFLKPRKLLCSHFWSIQQRVEFAMQELQERLKHNKPVFRALQTNVDSIQDDNPVKKNWIRVVAQLGSGVHPTPQDIIDCKTLFSEKPYHLDNLSFNHCGHLLKMHGMRRGILRRNRLKFRAFLLMEMDKAIIKEGGVKSLNAEALRNACHIRGLNGSHLSNQEMMSWLQKWLQVSEHVDKNTYSLLLHSPIFLAYNHPQNWMLIY